MANTTLEQDMDEAYEARARWDDTFPAGLGTVGDAPALSPDYGLRALWYTLTNPAELTLNPGEIVGVMLSLIALGVIFGLAVAAAF